HQSPLDISTLHHVQHFLFFFYCSVVSRHLHSFPTRRSSDLSPGRIRGSANRFESCCKGPTGCLRSGFCTVSLPRAARPEPRGLRSEEHTSELQSRGHLVCRLLLEKKKIIIHVLDILV